MLKNTSNDAIPYAMEISMKYLIILELQKLYSSKWFEPIANLLRSLFFFHNKRHSVKSV